MLVFTSQSIPEKPDYGKDKWRCLKNTYDPKSNILFRMNKNKHIECVSNNGKLCDIFSSDKCTHNESESKDYKLLSCENIDSSPYAKFNHWCAAGKRSMDVLYPKIIKEKYFDISQLTYSNNQATPEPLENKKQWRCLHNNNSRKPYIAVREGEDGNIECASSNDKTCYVIRNENKCHNLEDKSLPDKRIPCNKLERFDDYGRTINVNETLNHWCYGGKNVVNRRPRNANGTYTQKEKSSTDLTYTYDKNNKVIYPYDENNRVNKHEWRCLHKSGDNKNSVVVRKSLYPGTIECASNDKRNCIELPEYICKDKDRINNALNSYNLDDSIRCGTSTLNTRNGIDIIRSPNYWCNVGKTTINKQANAPVVLSDQSISANTTFTTIPNYANIKIDRNKWRCVDRSRGNISHYSPIPVRQSGNTVQCIKNNYNTCESVDAYYCRNNIDEFVNRKPKPRGIKECSEDEIKDPTNVCYHYKKQIDAKAPINDNESVVVPELINDIYKMPRDLWRCYDNGDHDYIIREKDNDVECLSFKNDGQCQTYGKNDCLVMPCTKRGRSCERISSRLKNKDMPTNVIRCGKEFFEKHGITGYNIPSFWCAKGKAMIEENANGFF